MAGKVPSSFCVIIPAFNEARGIEDVVARSLAVADRFVVVDDGSTDGTGERARSLGAHVLRHEVNLGKGASLIAGFAYATEEGCEAVISVDADGQHDPAEIPSFVDTYQRTRIPVLVGNRMWDAGAMPVVRRVTNRLMSRLLCRLMKQYLPDTQCGFRLYDCRVLAFSSTASTRFAMESEILLHLALRGIRMDSVRIATIYRGGRSRIRPVIDTIRFMTMLLQYHHDLKRSRNR